jgi:hypothetical protein
MSAPVGSVRNLGPAMAAALAQAGIDSAATIRALGFDAAPREIGVIRRG